MPGVSHHDEHERRRDSRARQEARRSNSKRNATVGIGNRPARSELHRFSSPRILKEKHIDTWQDFRASIRGFEHDSEQKYPNVDESRARILGDYTRIIEDIDNEMHKYFSAACRPATKCVVDRVPQFKEATSPMAYYFPAALDGKTPGTFFANLRNVDEVVKFKMGTLAYHEAVPGHHFQVSLLDAIASFSQTLVIGS